MSFLLSSRHLAKLLGPVGEGGKDVINYFAQHGAHCPPEKNVAEFILETAARPHRRPDGTKKDMEVRPGRVRVDAERVAGGRRKSEDLPG